MSVTETPEKTHAPVTHAKKVGYLQLTFMIYGASCGGAFGLEGMISGAGPGLALTMILMMPFIYSVPLALAVSELTALFPVEGGNYRWSRMSYGNFWGFQAGWWSWASGVVASASYAALFAAYVDNWMPQPGTPAFESWKSWLVVSELGVATLAPVPHWAVCLALIWVVHYLNVKGIDVVGDSAVIMTALLLAPFVVMTFLGITHWNHNPLVPFVAPGKSALDFGAAIALAIWLYSGYEKLSNAAEEVHEPQKVFPPALFSAAGLAVLSCLLPTMAAVACLGNWQDWSDGYFPKAASVMLGTGLMQAMLVGGLISNALLTNVTMMSVSRTVLAMSDDNLIPHGLSKVHPKYETPTVALLLGSVVLSAVSWFSFTQLVIAYVFLQMFSNLIIYCNLWTIRRTHSDMPRPFTVPGGLMGIVIIALPTVLLAIVDMVSSLFTKAATPDGGSVTQFDWTLFTIAIVATLSGPILYPISKLFLAKKEQG